MALMQVRIQDFEKGAPVRSKVADPVKWSLVEQQKLIIIAFISTQQLRFIVPQPISVLIT